jgi:hypothetical protein
MASATLTWWSLLCAVSLLNVLAWIASCAILRRRYASLHPATRTFVRLQALLSAVYVCGCAYRSVLPVYDIKRLCLVDSWLSSVLVGRSVATIAELCFAAQWALLLWSVAQAAGSPTAKHVARIVVPLIAVAELCSWYAVLTTSNLGHVLEESIWATCAALLVAGFVLVWRCCRRELRPMLAAVCAIGLGYVIYMVEVDVPMYWARWMVDVDHGRRYFSVAEGLADASRRWIVSSRWADWQSEVVWMSFYFSAAVWLSIGLIHVPEVLGSRNQLTAVKRAGSGARDRVVVSRRALHS